MSLDKKESVSRRENTFPGNTFPWTSRPLVDLWHRLIAVDGVDEEEARLGRFFNTLALISLGIGVILIVILLLALSRSGPGSVFVGEDDVQAGTLSSILAFAFPLVFIPLVVFCIFMIKRGFIEYAINFYIGLNYVGVALAVLLFGGHLSPVWLLFFWPMTVAAILWDFHPASRSGRTNHDWRANYGWRANYSWRTISLILGVILYYMLLYALQAGNVFTPPFNVSLRAFRFLSLSFGLLMLFSTSGLVTYLGMGSLWDTIARLHSTISQSEHRRHALAQSVEERTADLHRKAQQFRTIAELTQVTASISDLEALLNTSLQFIAERFSGVSRFSLHNVRVFLIDETGDWAILRAAISPGLEASHSPQVESLSDITTPLESHQGQGQRIRIAEQGIIGYVARTGRPHLSETHSEVALPLEAKGQIIGVLYIQTRKHQPYDYDGKRQQSETFNEEDVEMLRVLADNLAVAIENAMLLDEAQRTVERLERYQESETLSAWRRALARRDMELNYIYAGGNVRSAESVDFTPFEEVPTIPEQTIVRERNGADEHAQESVTSAYELIVPVQMQQRTIGVLMFENQRPWRQDEIQLAETVVQQLGLALENARLLEETQTRALQERSRSEIVSQLRALNSVDAILRSAARQLGRALKVERSRIQLTPEDSMPDLASNTPSAVSNPATSEQDNLPGGSDQ